MRVTFDSNVWEKVVSNEYIESKDLSLIRQSIEQRVIEPYICEVALSLESIMKKERLNHASNRQLKIEVVSSEWRDNKYKGVIGIGPDNDTHPGIPLILKHKLELAKDLGFKVLPMTNIGTARAKDINESLKIGFSSTDDFWVYAEKLAECGDFISSLECGFSGYENLLKKYKIKTSPHLMLNKLATKTEKKKFAQAVAEWSDGDSLAAHYAYDNDIFCTNDFGKGAGKASVFYPENLNVLSKKYNMRVVSVGELASIIST
ncbi:hypothetical protein MHM98_10525 [Psychrobium sp. MM17-31]|uniref:hypothetical protein n=1 Tax=Psychrobium sp. MM17-31 TaxID=2917758 RepID=UPI001EF42DE6|nr:hypothetical protein [Psychrobium sp. MM17-31]MCG7531777.1 hypothetical protein [Psychrobium sp. MM17-31]